jgi:hypothetical protein
MTTPARARDAGYRVPAEFTTQASVSKTCLVRFDKNKCSVASRAVGRPKRATWCDAPDSCCPRSARSNRRRCASQFGRSLPTICLRSDACRGLPATISLSPIAVQHKARCNKCHALSEEKWDVTTFTDNDFHNIGIGVIRHNGVARAQQAEQKINSGHLEEVDRAAVGTDFSALGRFLISKKEADIVAFKTLDIRNILVTGRYFHDGS